MKRLMERAMRWLGVCHELPKAAPPPSLPHELEEQIEAAKTRHVTESRKLQTAVLNQLEVTHLHQQSIKRTTDESIRAAAEALAIARGERGTQ